MSGDHTREPAALHDANRKRKRETVSKEPSSPAAERKQLSIGDDDGDASEDEHGDLGEGEEQPLQRKHQRKKVRRENTTTTATATTTTRAHPSINELKKQIRGTKRLLNRVNLAADVRVSQERALSGYEKDLEEETNRRKRSDMIKRYHFVRFLGACLFFSAFLPWRDMLMIPTNAPMKREKKRHKGT